MDIIRCRRHDRTHRYVAACIGGLFDPLPHWFEPLQEAGRIKAVEEGFSVLTITGNWRLVREGGYVVYQEDGTLWVLSAEDFGRTFYEV